MRRIKSSCTCSASGLVSVVYGCIDFLLRLDLIELMRSFQESEKVCTGTLSAVAEMPRYAEQTKKADRLAPLIHPG
jgi:hypothetical protein